MELAASFRIHGVQTPKAQIALDRRQESRVLRSRPSTVCVAHLRHKQSSPSAAAFEPEAVSPLGRLLCMLGKPL